jgi:predicted GTPase
MPNAGKSTLLVGRLAARPKIADYPFTTLEPQLGIVELIGDRRMVFADIPGLIEGAQHGAGLGHAFLRHIERTKIIVHLLDLFRWTAPTPPRTTRKIRGELEAFSPEVANKREVIAANKLDLAPDDTAAVDKLMQDLPDREIFAISGATRRASSRCWRNLENAEKASVRRRRVGSAHRGTSSVEYPHSSSNNAEWQPSHVAAANPLRGVRMETFMRTFGTFRRTPDILIRTPERSFVRREPYLERPNGAPLAITKSSYKPCVLGARRAGARQYCFTRVRTHRFQQCIAQRGGGDLTAGEVAVSSSCPP